MLGEHCTPAGGLDDYYGDPLEWLKSPQKRFSMREDVERSKPRRKSKQHVSPPHTHDAAPPRINRAMTMPVFKGKSPPFSHLDFDLPSATSSGRASPMPYSNVGHRGADLQTLDPTAFLLPSKPHGGDTPRSSTTRASAASRRASISILNSTSRGPFPITPTSNSIKSSRFSHNSSWRTMESSGSRSATAEHRNGASDAKLTNTLDSLIHDVENMRVSAEPSRASTDVEASPLPPSIARALTLPLAEKRRDSVSFRRRRPMDASKTSRIFGKDTFMSPPTRSISSRHSLSESQSARDSIESASDIAEKTAESLQRVSVKLGAFHHHERLERAKEVRTERAARTKMENELRLAAQKHRLADKKHEEAEKKLRDKLRRQRRETEAKSRAATIKSIQSSSRSIGNQYAARRFERRRSHFNESVEKRRASIAHETEDRLAYAEKNKQRHDYIRDMQLKTLGELRKAREEDSKERIEELDKESAAKLAEEAEKTKRRQQHAEQQSARVVAHRIANRRTDTSRGKSVRERKKALDKKAEAQKRLLFAQSQAARVEQLHRLESDRSRVAYVSSKSSSSMSKMS